MTSAARRSSKIACAVSRPLSLIEIKCILTASSSIAGSRITVKWTITPGTFTQVKHGLEEGIGLKPQLVIRSLRGVTHVAAETGMLQRRAARLLLLLTFMRKSVGMSEGLFVHHVRYLGAMQLLFTSQQLEAIAEEGKTAPIGSIHVIYDPCTHFWLST